MDYNFAELIEKLIIANIKLTKFDHYKDEEVRKENPDAQKVVEWERGARQANENRAKARNAINQYFAEIINKGQVEFIKEYRTFGK